MLVTNTSKHPLTFEAGLTLAPGESREFTADEQARHKAGLNMFAGVGYCKCDNFRTLPQFIAENEGILQSGSEKPANRDHRAASENSEPPTENIEENSDDAKKAHILAEIAAELQSDRNRSSTRQHSGKEKKPPKKRKRSRKVADKDEG